MGLFDFLSKPRVVVCPECRTKGALRTRGKVQCPNRDCCHYDPTLVTMPTTTETHPHRTRDQGGYHPGPEAVVVRYRNHAGDDVTFVADRTSVRPFENHISVRVVPTGRRITLAKKFIRNLSELGDVAVQELPRGVDRQILTYHLRQGTTSPRFEEVRRRFPHWSP